MLTIFNPKNTTLNYNTRKSFDDNLQIGLSLAADLALFAYGSCFTMSSVVLPQIEDASNTSDLTITSEEGSWFGNDLVIHNYKDKTYFHNLQNKKVRTC